MLPCNSPRANTGAALVTAMMFLIVITLLGITAMGATRLNLRMATNEELRVTAQQQAQSLIDAILFDTDANLALDRGAGMQHLCYPSGLVGDSAPLHAPFACASDSTAPTLPANFVLDHSYLEVFREAINGQPTVTVNAVPGSEDSYVFRFARYRITAGYDRSSEGFGAAEISEGVNIKVPTVDGMNIF
jgi:hypothetical protein